MFYSFNTTVHTKNNNFKIFSLEFYRDVTETRTDLHEAALTGNIAWCEEILKLNLAV